MTHVHIAKPQKFVGYQWIAIFADEPDTSTLWIYYGEELTASEKEECQRYAEKVAALINKDEVPGRYDEAKETDGD